MRREDVELLAPAGTWEALEAAVLPVPMRFIWVALLLALGPMPKILALKNCSGPSLLLTCTMFVSMSRSIPLSLMRK